MKFFTTILSVFISLIFLEIFVRYFIDDGMNYELEMMKYANQLKVLSKNKEIGIEHKKNITTKLMGVDISLDSNGFRNIQKLNNDKKKILMIGDSMTLGWGAKIPFANILNNQITNYDVINAGIGNTNTIMQISNFMENYKEKYSYKIIVLNFFINDFENVQVKKPNFFQKYSFFYTYLNNKINIILIKFNLKKDWQKFYTESYSNKEVQNNTLIQLSKLNDFCIKNRVKLIIHNIPELRDLKNYKFKEETNIIKNFANEKNIHFVDSISALKKHDEKDLWVTELDPHANDLAHRIIADFLKEKLDKFIN
ncbi:MAG: SGNH/GDSL hydrolase family protein [Candidatus Pelagibacter sp. TMED263]|nr:MAG: SGNH/GDSL hydrolase family protein [Candidatus Pelagibacter sp. TMED263]